MGKPERRHLKKLSEQINDYCLEKDVMVKVVVNLINHNN